MSRAYAGERDTPALLNLLRAGRVAATVDRYPTRFRLELLLSSRLQAPTRDARLWTGALDAPLGFAALLSRASERASASPILLVHPRVADSGLEEELLEWCEAWAMERAAERGVAISLDVGACEDEVTTRDLLIRHGFVARADVQNVYLVRSLDVPLPAPARAASCRVRRLTGADELEAYEALFSFSAMRRSHRLALLRDRCATLPICIWSSSAPMTPSSPSANAPSTQTNGRAEAVAPVGWTTSARARTCGGTVSAGWYYA